MGDINELFSKVKSLNSDIKTILKYSQYETYDDLSGLNININNPEEMLVWDELRGIVQKLSDVENSISYLSKPILYTGTIHKNSQGRYELDNGKHYYTCGSTIEAYIYDDYDERYSWVKSSVEHDKDYYIVGYKEINMDGLKVRVRG